MNGLMGLRIIYGCFPLTVFMYACRSTLLIEMPDLSSHMIVVLGVARLGVGCQGMNTISFTFFHFHCCMYQCPALCLCATRHESYVFQMTCAVPADSSQFVRVWHFTSKTCLASLQEDRQTLAAAYSCDYKYFATAGSNTTILMYDTATNQLMNTLEARWGEQSWRESAV